MNRKNFKLKIAALTFVSLAVLVTPSAYAEKKGKAAAGPSMKETTGFIRDRLIGCGTFSQQKSQDGAPWFSVKYYTWRTVDFESATLRVEEEAAEHISINGGENYGFPTSAEEGLSSDGYVVKNHREANRLRISTAEVNLADLSPDINVLTEGGLAIKVSCSSGSCVHLGDGRLINYWNFEVCGKQEDADRIAKALTHAIELAGGKKPLF